MDRGNWELAKIEKKKKKKRVVRGVNRPKETVRTRRKKKINK
jgi:hypothetical protein